MSKYIYTSVLGICIPSISALLALSTSSKRVLLEHFSPPRLRIDSHMTAQLLLIKRHYYYSHLCYALQHADLSGEIMTPSSGRAIFYQAVHSGLKSQIVDMHSTGLDDTDCDLQGTRNGRCYSTGGPSRHLSLMR